MKAPMAVWLALLAPAASADTVFDRASGSFGAIGVVHLSCAANPVRVGFSANRTRAHFKWDQPIVDYEGEWRTRADYTILSHDETSITMRLDDESRVDSTGAPKIWRYDLFDNGNACWRDAEWSYGFCLSSYEPCVSDPPVS